MPSIYTYKNFKSFLKDDLELRSLRNPKYSLRAYARDLNMSFSRLSEVLSGPEGISLSTAQKIAKSLKLSLSEQDYFINLVISKHSQNAHMRKNSLEKIKKYQAKRKFVSLSKNFNGILSKWYYLPLIEILVLNFENSVEKLANILKIERAAVAEAVHFLEEVGYLKRDERGFWIKATPFLKIESTVPSALIRDFHHKLIQKADEALECQPIDNRKYLSTVMGFRKESLVEARAELEQFHQKFLKKYTSSDNAETVYCVTFQFFELDNKKDLT